MLFFKILICVLAIGGSQGFQPAPVVVSRAKGSTIITSSRSSSYTQLSLLPKQQEEFFPFQRSPEANKLQAKNSDSSSDDGSLRQLLGVKGASAESNIWKIRLQLTKPVTWVPLVWYDAICFEV
jgi:chlorophyll synthase